jgi:Fe-S-cluster-containing dehydrogenase component
MKKWNLINDLALCTGCQNCVLAVKDEYIDNSFPGYSAPMPRHGANWVDIERHERGTFPAVDVVFLFRCCQHCDNAPCMRAAKDGAVRKREDGLVLIDPERAKGQKAIAKACPYGAVHWNEAHSLPQHWNFDSHLIDGGWSVPRPVQACPTGALRALKIEYEAMQRLAQSEGLERLAAGEKNGTRVYYRNLDRYTCSFVAGTLLGEESGLQACVAGARVKLLHGTETVAETASDAFGDFRFDSLPPSSGSYRIVIETDAYRQRELEFTLEDSQWLGEIRLDRA